MIANFIFHFIIAVFFIWGIVAWYFLNNRLLSLKKSLIPALCTEQLNPIQHKSLVIRAFRTIENELSILLKAKIKIKIDETLLKDNLHLKLNALSCLLNPNLATLNFIYKFKNKIFNNQQLMTELANYTELKYLYFSSRVDDNSNPFWLVETKNEN